MAVHRLSLDIEEGSMVGLMGHNGSGKSTTLKMVLGFIKPSEGTVLTFGKGRPCLEQMGYLPENPRFPKFLTARSLMRYYGKLRQTSKTKNSTPQLEDEIERLIESVNLFASIDHPISGFSKGMTQRLGIAQALLGSPKLLILDEPMSGLDPMGRDRLRSILSLIHRKHPETTLLFTSHVYQDVEELCDKVVVLKSGELFYEGSAEQIPKGTFTEEYEA